MDYRAGMFVYAVAFLLGIIYVQQLEALPSFLTQFLILGFVCLYSVVHVLFIRHRHDYIRQITLIMLPIVLILLGIKYSSYYAGQQLSFRFNESLIAQNIVILGRVTGIPVADDKVKRFEFDVESHKVLSGDNVQGSEQFPKKIRLSWYYGQPVNAGDKWQLEVRLKPPHGFMNPGAFDYEAWLFQQSIDATGYVRRSSLNRLEQASPTSIDYIRQSISRQIDTIAGKQKTVDADINEIGSFALLKALAVGDKSSISNPQWRVLANTGTSHLMAISGLHIGLASLFAYVLIRRIVPAVVIKRIPAQHIALSGGLLTAFLYALVAGLSVPTQRAIIMLAVLSAMFMLRRNHRPIDALGFALLSVLILDPLAVLSAGFWFSFSAVAVIFISLSPTTADSSEDRAVVNTSYLSRGLLILKHWIRLQLLISLFLLPLSLFMFQQVSLISPAVNLLLIPYVSFLVVPLVLLALICLYIAPPVADSLFIMAAYLLDLVWLPLSYLSAQPYSLWVRGGVDVAELAAAAVLMLLLFFSAEISDHVFRRTAEKTRIYARWVLRCALCLLFIPLMTVPQPGLAAGEYQLTVLDVGQGSAAVIKTQNHVAVFDSGAKFSDRLDAGSGVVIPYLRSRGIKSLDRLIISHGDADHIGGAPAILDEYPEVTVSGQDIESLQSRNKQLCYAGEKWHWDGVDFAYLSPAAGQVEAVRSDKRNNRSCVLKVSSSSGSVLFTGDIEKKIEQKLLLEYGERLNSDVLLVPHHGSNTSSSAAFIDAVDPVVSIISVGYKNRYRLPNERVIQRYDASGGEWIQTDKSGALTIKMTAEPGLEIEKYREKAGKYWHHIDK